MNDFINQVKNNPEIKQEINQSYRAFSQLNITSQGEASKTLFIKQKYMEKACEVIEETIGDLLDENDDLKNENNILSNKLNRFGDYDKEEVDRLIISQRRSKSNQEKRQRVRERLQQTLNKTENVLKN